MADKTHFSLVSPEKELFHGEVEHIIIPGSEGQFGALARHANTMTTVKAGIVRVLDGNKETKIYVGGGIVDVTTSGVIILAEDAVDVASFDKNDLAHQIKNASEDLRDAKTDAEKTKAAKTIARLELIATAI